MAFDQETDSYQFSSPDVISTAQPLNKCDAATQEISRNNKRTLREPPFKVYGKAKLKTSAKGKESVKNKAVRGNGAVLPFHNDKGGVHGEKEKVTRNGGKILVCQKGKLLSRGDDHSEKGVVEDSHSPRASKRIQAKEKCFGKGLQTRRVKKTVSSVVHVSPCSDHEDGNNEQNDHQLIENADNLQFGPQEEDGCIVDTEEETVGDSFTRVKSKGEKGQGKAGWVLSVIAFTVF